MTFTRQGYTASMQAVEVGPEEGRPDTPLAPSLRYEPANGFRYWDGTDWIPFALGDLDDIQDLVGNMVASNTETGIVVTYQSSDGTIDFVVDTASTTQPGIAELATSAETITGTDTARVVTPAGAAAAYQPLDTDLTAIAALATTSYGRSVLATADAAALRTLAGLVIGTNVQAFDSDLAAVAALSTTSYGRAFLELANQAALMALLSSASTTAEGKVELATSAETITGTDTARAVTPAGGLAALDNRISAATVTDLTDGGDTTLHIHAADRARANHSGTQTASTISDFDTQVRTSRLNEMAPPDGPVDMSNESITNLASPASPDAAATKGYVDGLGTASTDVLSHKNPVRVASTANVAIASLNHGDSIDGVTVATGDRVLLKDQSSSAENGIYTVGPAPLDAARSEDANTSAKVKAGMSVKVNEGTANADTEWTLTTNGAVTLESTSLTFTRSDGAGAYRAGGTDVAVADGGTGASTAAAGFDALKQAATTSYVGAVELATDSETQTQTDTGRAVTPSNLGALAWTNYTPSIVQSGAVSSTIDYSRYFVLGKMVTFIWRLVCTANGTTNNAITVSLPVTAAASGIDVGVFTVFDGSAGQRYVGAGNLLSTTTVRGIIHTGTSSIGVAPNFGLANGQDIVLGAITYPAA